MKKALFGIAGIIVVVLIYYFTAGSTQVVKEMKKQVNHELTTLQQNGFNIEEREIKAKREHFTVTFSEPEKIAAYLAAKGTKVKAEELANLKGMKFAIDAVYLKDNYSALSVDIYPKALPNEAVNALKKENPKLLKHIEKLIADKTLLTHIDFNKLLSAFKGYVKDIDETFQDNTQDNSHNNTIISILAKGMTFEGSIANEKLKELHQHIAQLSLFLNKEAEMSLKNISGTYAIAGKSKYDTKSSYAAEELKVSAVNYFNIFFLNIRGSSTTALHDKLLKSSVKNSVGEIKVQEKQKSYMLKNTSLDVSLDNLDIEAFEKLQKVNPQDNSAINRLLEQIFTQGIELNIADFSVKEVTINKQPVGDFHLNAHGKIDSSFNLTTAQQNPLILLQALSVKTHLEISPALFTHLTQDPRAMVLLMIIPPQEKNGKKVYNLQYTKGKLTVNGVSL